jgi:hypothetical protein
MRWESSFRGISNARRLVLQRHGNGSARLLAIGFVAVAPFW